jgi:hypothetical protein
MWYVWRMVTSSNSSFGSDDNAHAHAHSRCEDAPCCGCCPSGAEYYDPCDEIEADLLGDGDDCTQDLGEEDEGGMTDVEADADTLASAGWGTDEDYGDFGGEDSWLDSHWESQNEVDFGGDF